MIVPKLLFWILDVSNLDFLRIHFMLVTLENGSIWLLKLLKKNFERILIRIDDK